MSLILGTWGTLATFPFGLFAGIILSAQFIGLYNCAPKQHMATAISMYYMSQQVGIALGISITSSLMMQRFQATLLKNLVHVPEYEEVSRDSSPSFRKEMYLKNGWQIIRGILTDSSLVALLSTAVKTLVRQSYLNSFWVVPSVLFHSASYLINHGT
jgi:hypothetical protein